MAVKVIALLTMVFMLFGCGRQSNDKAIESVESVKFASFNVSFAHDGDPSENFRQWVGFMTIPVARQRQLVADWQANSLNHRDRRLAERVMQIRNIAAIIQNNRPDVLLLTEFNNDGEGHNDEAIKGFQENYLAVAQSLNGVDGGALQQPITYPYVGNYATNTGRPSGMDLARQGDAPANPNNAHGFGFYHGHYAFALLSRYPIDHDNTRTFMTFKRKDLPSVVMPTINVCDGSKTLPEGMQCGDNWFSPQAWDTVRLSSKNHVDAPIIIPHKNGAKVIHALLSHPTPAAFDTVSDNNKYRNSEEVAFWAYYLDNNEVIYDDRGQRGGLTDESFVIMGDLNADAEFGAGQDQRFNGIQTLMRHPRVHQGVASVHGEHVPVSAGARVESNPKGHPYPETRTATFGMRVDYSVPSSDLNVLDTGVYWQAPNQPGRLLFNDSRIGSRGTDKEVSSDHRFVWTRVKVE